MKPFRGVSTHPGGVPVPLVLLIAVALPGRPAAQEVVAPPGPLSTLVVPLPPDLGVFVSDMDRAAELGKALFWDVQVGSDGLTACASCHFHAGVDARVKNSLSPGADGVFAALGSGAGGPNHTLGAADFPFVKHLVPNTGADRVADLDDVRGTAGVLATDFTASQPGRRRDLGVDQDDALFQVGGVDTLRTTGRDAPTVIGAVYLDRLFWDGRANHFFNGANIWGEADSTAPTVLERRPDGSLGPVPILLENAACASQAIGPPLSGVEMSWVGRDWPDVGRKLIRSRPLAQQVVDPTDGVLGTLANPTRPGLVAGLFYEDMIRSAFHSRWWGSDRTTADGHTQMEANFALFFGLSILCYESTLIPDQTPFDRFVQGDATALDAAAQRGMQTFLGRGACFGCHATSNFAGAVNPAALVNVPAEPGEVLGARMERMNMGRGITTPALVFSTAPAPGELPLTFNPYRRVVALVDPNGRLLAATTLPPGQRCPQAGETVFPLQPTGFVSPLAEFTGNFRIEADGMCGFRMVAEFRWNDFGPPTGLYTLIVGGQSFVMFVSSPIFSAIYDVGFYNVGVRPAGEDPGVGGDGPFGPLALTRRTQNGEDIRFFVGFTEVLPTDRTAVRGSFKTPTLRNIELTGPYMHTGSMASLEQVVEFYARGTDFPAQADLDPEVVGFALTEQDKSDLVAFLKSLTDPRVRHEQAPFDHPALPMKAGHVGDALSVPANGEGNGVFELSVLPATGAAGGPALPTFEERLAASVSLHARSVQAAQAEVALVCDRRPVAPVTVDLSILGGGTVQPASVTFTPDDWRVTRSVTVAPTGGVPPSGLALLLVTSRAASADPAFANLVVPDLAISLPGGP